MYFNLIGSWILKIHLLFVHIIHPCLGFPVCELLRDSPGFSGILRDSPLPVDFSASSPPISAHRWLLLEISGHLRSPVTFLSHLRSPLTFFLSQNFLTPNIIWSQIKIFLTPKTFFWPEIFFDPKTFFDPNFFFDPRIFFDPKFFLTQTFFLTPKKLDSNFGIKKIHWWISGEFRSPVNIFTDRPVNSGLRSIYLLTGENPVISGENLSFSGRSPVDFSDSPESWDRGVLLGTFVHIFNRKLPSPRHDL